MWVKGHPFIAGGLFNAFVQVNLSMFGLKGDRMYGMLIFNV